MTYEHYTGMKNNITDVDRVRTNTNQLHEELCGQPTQVHFAITDYINVYVCNIPTEYPMTAAYFTQQDQYFVVIHTTEQLLKNLKDDLEYRAQRADMAGWYARKDNDHQFQIKAGAELERLGGDMDGRSITVSNYMELKVAYKQIHRTVIEDK
eukprot:6139011-Amphidinium_carterae.1